MKGLPGLKARREELRMTQQEVAKMLQPPLTAKAIYLYESGRRRPDSDTIVQLATALRTDANAILSVSATA